MTGGLLLALETATPATSVALVAPSGECLGEVDDDAGRPHSERLLLAIEEVLAQAGAAKQDVGAYAVSLGPGSFTGLRIGLATVQGFSLVDGRPVIGVPTLAALAIAADAQGPVAALLDARRGEVYAAGYPDPTEVDATLLAEGLYTPEAVAAALPEGGCLVAGAGADAAVEAALRARPDLRILKTPCRARRVGVLAARLAPTPAPLAPRYIRRAEAEVKRTGHSTE